MEKATGGVGMEKAELAIKALKEERKKLKQKSKELEDEKVELLATIGRLRNNLSKAEQVVNDADAARPRVKKYVARAFSMGKKQRRVLEISRELLRGLCGKQSADLSSLDAEAVLASTEELLAQVWWSKLPRLWSRQDVNSISWK
jgi:chromosome segregation ATPase